MANSNESNLKRFERIALTIGRLANESQVGKQVQHRFVRSLCYTWMAPFMSRRTYVDNIDWLIAPPSNKGVLFACNHRTFFDSFLYTFSLFARGAKWTRKLYYPVRSNFFYDSPLGVLVNLTAGGLCLYPPIYRDSDKKDLNNDALQRICTFLATPNCLVGLHPEGKRNQGDPYTLLPAQPGIGQIVLKAKPLVVPLFVNGLENDFLLSLRTSLKKGAKQEAPVIITFGNPIDYQEFLTQKPRAAIYKRCADRINAAVSDCGQREKEIRAAISAGTIADSDPNWLSPK